MRMLIVTDSLGMPSVLQSGTKVNDLWVNKLISNYGDKFIIYTFLIRSLTTSNLVHDISLIQDLFFRFQPSVIIFQVGINDCVRRALPRRFLMVVSHIPIIGRLFHSFSKKFHFWLTKIFDIHEVDKEKFAENLDYVLYASLRKNIKVAFIRIADAGRKVVENIFNSQRDIDYYNMILQSKISQYRNATYIEPFNRLFVNDYILEEDGSHLNVFGHQVVFEAIKKWLDSDMVSMEK